MERLVFFFLVVALLSNFHQQERVFIIDLSIKASPVFLFIFENDSGYVILLPQSSHATELLAIHLATKTPSAPYIQTPASVT